MICAIITPVGPGHADTFRDSCAPSVAQAAAYSRGPFTEIRHLDMDDTAGAHGRSSRRNDAVRDAVAAGADWVFFLDADDLMAPNAFEAFGAILSEEPALDAVWGLICELDPDGEPSLREGQPERLDSREAFLATPPFQAVQIGGFVRAGVAAAHPFDTGKDTGEDYAFYRALWAGHTCAKRPVIFFLNRRGAHSTGPRSATGRDWVRDVDAQWRAEVRDADVWLPVDHAGTTLTLPLDDPTHPDGAALLQGALPQAELLDRLEPHLGLGPVVADIGESGLDRVLWALRHLGAARVWSGRRGAARQALDAAAARNAVAERLERWAEPALAEAPATGAVPLPLPSKDSIDLLHVGCGAASADILADRLAPLVARDRPAVLIELGADTLLRFARDWCRGTGYRMIDSGRIQGGKLCFALPTEKLHDR